MSRSVSTEASSSVKKVSNVYDSSRSESRSATMCNQNENQSEKFLVPSSFMDWGETSSLISTISDGPTTVFTADLDSKPIQSKRRVRGTSSSIQSYTPSLASDSDRTSKSLFENFPSKPRLAYDQFGVGQSRNIVDCDDASRSRPVPTNATPSDEFDSRRPWRNLTKDMHPKLDVSITDNNSVTTYQTQKSSPRGTSNRRHTSVSDDGAGLYSSSDITEIALAKSALNQHTLIKSIPSSNNNKNNNVSIEQDYLSPCLTVYKTTPTNKIKKIPPNSSRTTGKSNFQSSHLHSNYLSTVMEHSNGFDNQSESTTSNISESHTSISRTTTSVSSKFSTNPQPYLNRPLKSKIKEEGHHHHQSDNSSSGHSSHGKDENDLSLTLDPTDMPRTKQTNDKSLDRIQMDANLTSKVDTIMNSNCHSSQIHVTGRREVQSSSSYHSNQSSVKITPKPTHQILSDEASSIERNLRLSDSNLSRCLETININDENRITVGDSLVINQTEAEVKSNETPLDIRNTEEFRMNSLCCIKMLLLCKFMKKKEK